MVREYIFLAVGCAMAGVVITFFVLVGSLRMGIDVFGEQIWVLAIPAVISVTLNVILLELYRKLWRKK